MRLSLVIALIGLVTASQQAAFAESAPISLAKVGPWEMNYDIDSCHLQAKFGTGDREILIDLNRFEPTDSFDLALYGKPLAADSLRVDVGVAFGSQQNFFKKSALTGSSSVPQKRPLMLISGLQINQRDDESKDQPAISTVTPADEAAINSISFKLSSRRHYRLETGSLGAPFKALRKCTTDLVKSWGYDPEVQAKLSKPPEPTGKPERWLTPNDYPAEAIQRGQSGRLSFRLDVEETGKVSGCRVLYRTNPDEFADLTCKLLLKRATMSPAHDAQGKPVRSFYVRNVLWLAG